MTSPFSREEPSPSACTAWATASQSIRSARTRRALIFAKSVQGVYGPDSPDPVVCNVPNATAALPSSITDGDGKLVIDIAEFPTQRQVDSTPGQLFSAGGLPGVLLTGSTITTLGIAGAVSICQGRQVPRHLHQPRAFHQRLDVRFRERQVAAAGHPTNERISHMSLNLVAIRKLTVVLLAAASAAACSGESPVVPSPPSAGGDLSAKPSQAVPGLYDLSFNILNNGAIYQEVSSLPVAQR